jgi:hypothetical protein
VRGKLLIKPLAHFAETRGDFFRSHVAELRECLSCGISGRHGEVILSRGERAATARARFMSPLAVAN